MPKENSGRKSDQARIAVSLAFTAALLVFSVFTNSSVHFFRAICFPFTTITKRFV